ncbi:MAG: hypothetical protein EZS28_053323, partial [Streblomastix strix]
MYEDESQMQIEQQEQQKLLKEAEASKTSLNSQKVQDVTTTPAHLQAIQQQDDENIDYVSEIIDEEDEDINQKLNNQQDKDYNEKLKKKDNQEEVNEREKEIEQKIDEGQQDNEQEQEQEQEIDLKKGKVKITVIGVKDVTGVDSNGKSDPF